jgi:hypothetical protein
MHKSLLLIAAVALSACRSNSVANTPLSPGALATEAPAPHSNHVLPPNSEPLPLTELAKTRKATARYQNIENALEDGYVDINVVLPNMGRHFLKEALLDATFDAERPELLVYTEQAGGHRSLVAVEYAVPLSLSATAPEGFRGGADVWFADQNFKLWTLHAWVWRDNADGIFNPTNKKVP